MNKVKWCPILKGDCNQHKCEWWIAAPSVGRCAISQIALGTARAAGAVESVDNSTYAVSEAVNSINRRMR